MSVVCLFVCLSVRTWHVIKSIQTSTVRLPTLLAYHDRYDRTSRMYDYVRTTTYDRLRQVIGYLYLIVLLLHECVNMTYIGLHIAYQFVLVKESLQWSLIVITRQQVKTQ